MLLSGDIYVSSNYTTHGDFDVGIAFNNIALSLIRYLNMLWTKLLIKNNLQLFYIQYSPT